MSLKASLRKKRDKTVKKEIEWITPTVEDKTRNGIFWIGAGNTGSGKSATFGGIYMLNSEFASKWKDWFPFCWQLLKKGLMSDVTELYIVDTEIVWRDRLLSQNFPQLQWLFKPALKKKMIKVIELFGEDSRGLRNSSKSLEMALEISANLLSITHEGSAVLYDSATELKKDLDDDFKLALGKNPYGQSTMTFGEEAHANIRRTFYGQRNARWKAIMLNFRKMNGHKLLAFKTQQKFDNKNQIYLEGKHNSYPTLVKDSEFWFDVAVRFWRETKVVEKAEVTLKRVCEVIPSWGTKFDYKGGSFILYDDSNHCKSKQIKPDRYNFLRLLEMFAEPIVEGQIELNGI